MTPDIPPKKGPVIIYWAMLERVPVVTMKYIKNDGPLENSITFPNSLNIIMLKRIWGMEK